jgi:hypothetical protein
MRGPARSWSDDASDRYEASAVEGRLLLPDRVAAMAHDLFG